MFRSAPLALGLAASCLLAACAGPPAQRASGGQRCTVPFNAGSRLPGYANPAYPRSGLYPAPGGLPPGRAPALTLRVRAAQLVATFGQPLEHTSTLHSRMVTATPAGNWRTLALPAGYTFDLFGSAVPVFGVVPAPLLSGSHASGLRYVWLVTQWTAVQSITVLQGTPALASSTPDWRQIPPGVASANLKRAAAQVSADETAGWKPVGVYPATAACGTTASNLGPFGARATLRLPLGVPLRLVVPQFGSVTLTISDG